MSEIAVIGAGPAGLMAGLAASESGHRVTILEAADAVGGMSGSFEIAGQRVDFGSHLLHPSTAPEFMDRLRTLLGDDLQTFERSGRIRLNGRWVGYPLRLLDTARSLPPAFTFNTALDTVLRPLRPRSGDSFEAEVTARLGPTVAREFYAPYARKLYGVEAAGLTSELADRRVSMRSPIKVMATAFRARRPETRRFLYPRRGFGQISERLAEAAVEAGADLCLSHRVERIVDHGNRVEVASAGTRVKADLVLSTMPLPALVAALDPPPPAEVAEAVARLRVRSLTLVYLVVPRDQYTPFDTHFFPEKGIHVSRLSEPKNCRSGDDPVGQTVVCAEIPGDVGDRIWTASTEELEALVRGELDRAGLPDPTPAATEIRRLPTVYQVYDRAGQWARDIANDWVAAPDRVVSLGRQGIGGFDSTHHVMSMGAAAAAAVGPDGSFDRSQWEQSLQRFAAHVVVD